MVYAVTLSESQRVMCWRLIHEEFRPDIQHIAGVYNILADTFIRLPYTSVDMYKPRTSKAQCRVNKFFAIGREENNKDFPH